MNGQFGCEFGQNSAVTYASDDTMHVDEVPEQEPPQPLNWFPVDGVAVIVTMVVPAGNRRAQKLLQLPMLGTGENEMVPLPERVNSIWTVNGGVRKLAEIVSDPVIVNVHVVELVHPTDGPLPPQLPHW